MLTIGLTGGIASGKSTVAQQFAALGVPVIDTDVIARELVAPEQPALSAIVAHFGAQALRPDGQLNRPWLRQRIFSDASARSALNAIMHPRIRAQVGFELDALRQKPPAYVIVVVPLLVESQNYDDLVQRVAVVDLPEEEQLRRLKARDNIDTTQAQAILDSQASRSQRLQRADDVIDNSGTTTELASQVETLHEHYSRLAEQSKGQ
ncbi:MAG TPA: dephospho-CoA kinase [bacterium]|nr:dephospho-CoA kinase [bacterium]